MGKLPWLNKKGKMSIDDESMLNDCIMHINEISVLLGQENIVCMDDDIPSTIDKLHDQLSLITALLSEGQYLPRGEIQNKIERLENSESQLQTKLQEAQKQTEDLSGKIIDLTRENSDLCQQVAEMKNKLGDSQILLEQANIDKQQMRCQLEEKKIYSDQMEKVVHKREENFVNLCNSVISFRDQLFAQLTFAEAEQNPQAIDIIKGIIILSRGVLEENNIEILDQGGVYDREVQYIAGSVSADRKEQDMQIKETVKEGYRFESKLIRQQEVILQRFCQDS